MAGLRMTRTGELCPTCKQGRLQPTGQANWNKTDKDKGVFQEGRGYQCDNPDCATFHAEMKAGVGVSASAKVEPK
jgi:hypothetical protein